MRAFGLRSIILAALLAALAIFRMSLNGYHKPDFIPDQNPAAFDKAFVTRFFSIPWVHVLYIKTFFYPIDLCCDWSGRSIELIRSIFDPRASLVIAAIVIFLIAVKRAFLEHPHSEASRDARAFFFAWMFVPFLLSSNLVVAAGTMKAERVVYLPSLGPCMGCALGIRWIARRLTNERKGGRSSSFILLAVAGVVVAGCMPTLRRRNDDWSDSLKLWKAAREINKKSVHTLYNYGLEESYRGNRTVAIEMMEMAHEIDPHDLTTSFVLSLLYAYSGNHKQCTDLALDGLRKLEWKRESGVHDIRVKYARDESNMLTAYAMGLTDVSLRGKVLYEAIQVDPTNTFAVERGTELLQKAGELGILPTFDD